MRRAVDHVLSHPMSTLRNQRVGLGRDDYAEEAGQYVLPRSEKKRILQKEHLGERSQQISLEESFQVYQQLYEEQQRIIESGVDIEALRMGLLSLPTLKCVTLTSET